MAEVLLLLPVRKRTNDAKPRREQDTVPAEVTHMRSEDGKSGGTIIPVDFESKDLQLLRYRARDLEEARFLLYKQSTRTEINTGDGNRSIAVRVLVQKRMVQYYFYCPSCGTKVSGTLFSKVHGGENYAFAQWRDIEDAVHNEVRMKVLDHEYRSHGKGKQTG